MAYGWFRFYNDAVNDPKVQRLAPPLFKFWVNLLCLTSIRACGGRIPSPHDMSFALRMPESETLECVSYLLTFGLLDDKKTGIEIHNWSKRQYKSDTSTERVKRYRKRSRNVTETPPETEQNQSRTEENKDSKFEEFWLACPRKENRVAAERAWPKALKQTDAQTIIQAMRRYAAYRAEQADPYTLYPATWLAQQRWMDSVGSDAEELDLSPERVAELQDKTDRIMKRGKYVEKFG